MAGAQTNRFSFSTLAIGVALCIGPSAADDASPQPEDQAGKKESLRVMLEQAQRILVKVGAAEKCQLKETPLIHYSDQVRRLPDSTLWLWEENSRPVLFCKIERVADAAGTTKSWQYACSPATASKTDVTWGKNFRWRARELSFRWTALPNVAPPRDQARARLTQLKNIAREFSGRTRQTPAKTEQEMRLLTRPLYQYADPKQNIVDGAVFGLTSNGTNPDALLLVEALGEPEEKSSWRYAIVGMTGDAVEVSREGKQVWSKEFSDGPGDYRSWMWYVAAP
jgi:hypothetical protein